MSMKTMICDTLKCPRCEGEHLSMTYTYFTRPCVVGGERLMAWAWCPTLSEPILMNSVPPTNEYAGRVVRKPLDSDVAQ